MVILMFVFDQHIPAAASQQQYCAPSDKKQATLALHGPLLMIDILCCKTLLFYGWILAVAILDDTLSYVAVSRLLSMPLFGL